LRHNSEGAQIHHVRRVASEISPDEHDRDRLLEAISTLDQGLTRALEALERSEARYRQLFEQVNDALYVHDLEGNFQMFNEAGLRLTGYSAEDAQHVKVRDLVAPEYHPFLDDLNPHIFAGENLPPWPVEIITKDGRRIPVEVSIHLLRDDAGEPYGVLGVARDATERKRVEDALRESERKYAEAYERERQAAEHLRALDALKSDFLSMVSHELRTPLTAIKGFTDTLLTHGGKLEEHQREQFVERISAQATSLEALITQLLDFSRWEQGKLTVQAEACDLRSIIEEVVDGLASTLAAHRVEIDIPAGTTVDADREACHRILDNLLTNAAKFSQPDTTIRIDALSQADSVIVTVTDEGVGVDPAEAERIFERFYRIERGDRARTKGTGVGLAIVKQYVEAQGGQVWVDSCPGLGSAFRFTLARAPISIGQAEANASTA
jgi:PAS domain S-box-containing protein